MKHPTLPIRMQNISSFQKLIDQAPVAITVLMGPNFMVHTANRKQLELWQRHAEEVLNRPLFEVLPETRSQAFEGLLTEVYQTGNTYKAEERPAQFLRNGKLDIGWFDFTYEPLRTDTGDVEGIMVVSNEVTDKVLAIKRDLAVQKEKNEALLASEEFSRTVLEASPDCVKVLDSEGRLLYMNYNGQCLMEIDDFGVLKNKCWWNLWPESVQQLVETAVRKAAGGEPSRFQAFCPTAKGIPKWWDVSISAQRNSEGKVERIISVSRDITEQKNSVASLRKQSETLAIGAKVSGLCLAEVDYATGTVSLSPETAALYGLSGTLVSRETVHASFHPDERAWMAGLIAECLNPDGNGLIAVEHRVVHPSGEERWLNVRKQVFFDRSVQPAKPVYAILAATDITKQKEAANRLQMAQDAGKAGFFIWHVEENKAFITGYLQQLLKANKNSGEIAFADWERAINAGDNRRVLSLMKQAFAEMRQRLSYEFRLQISETQIWLGAETFIEYNKDGKPVRVVGINYDITERKRVEQELWKQEQFTRSILDAAPSLTYIFDLQRGVNEFISKQTIDVLGYTEAAIHEMGNGLLTLLLHPDDVPVTNARFELLMGDTEDQTFEAEYRMKHKDGHWVWLFDRVRVFKRDEHGKPIQVLGVATDITTRKQLEAKTREQFDELENIYQNAPIGLAIIDKAFRFVRINERLAEMNGIPAKDHVGKGIAEIVPGVAEQAKSIFQKVFDTGAPVLDVELRGQTLAMPGVERVWNESWHPVKNNYGETFAISIVVEEITERKKAEESLRQSEEQFRTLTQAMPQVVWTANKNGEVDFANDLWFAYTGSTLEATLGYGWATYVYPDDKTLLLEQWSSALQHSLPIATEFRVQGKDGEYKWFSGTVKPIISEDGVVTKWLGTLVNIDDRKKAELLIKESEAHFRNMSENSPMWVWMTDEEVNIRYANQEMLSYLGLPNAEAFLGHVWEKLTHPDDLQIVYAAYGEAAKAQRAFAFESRVKNSSNGRFEWCLFKGVPHVEKGKFVGFIGTGLHIQQQKELTETLNTLVKERTQQLEVANAELQRSNQELQQFAHVASHDLKEPVRKVMTFVSRINTEFDDVMPEEAKGYLTKITSAAKRSYNMIEGVLHYSSLGAYEQNKEAVDLNLIVDNVLSDLEVMIVQKSAVVEKSMLPSVQGYAMLLHQLLYNLLVNSLKFTKRDVPPVITIRSKIVAGKAMGNNADGSKQYLQLTIQDNGIGFPKEYTGHIFHTFSRLHSKDRYEGSGMGLAICKKIAERHGGFITAQSEEGKGAAFTVSLPIDNN